jgi:integrase
VVSSSGCLPAAFSHCGSGPCGGLLHETAARANELLALDVEDLDLANRRARMHRKGGAVEWVFWQAASAQLLPRLLASRTVGRGVMRDDPLVANTS